MGSYYQQTVGTFLRTPFDPDLVSALMRGYQRDAYPDLKMTAVTAWQEEVEVLKRALDGIEGSSSWGIALEFTIPRRFGRIDAVLLLGQALLVLEFKKEQVDSAAAIQVEDYALDLLYFHSTSKGRRIFPIVVGADSTHCSKRKPRAIHENLEPTRFSTYSDLGSVVSEIAASEHGREQVDVSAWAAGEYRPVPTVIEAAIGM